MIEQWRKELREIQASWEYAYAMGSRHHGDHEKFKEIRARADELYFNIKAHEMMEGN